VPRAQLTLLDPAAARAWFKEKLGPLARFEVLGLRVAALAWTEAVTSLREGSVPDDVFEFARSEFSEQELVKLTIAIVAINGANRISIAFRTVPGSYRPAVRDAAE
jgi:alkylhydroperoxidase family enzyme